ncbi:MAG: DUF4363 family protein [Clostridia bacterium]|nr:DUF4363 family protein [Clostridia bacterium]
MKKLIAALAILALIVSASVVEIVYLERTYDGVLARLHTVEEKIDADFEHVDSADTVAAMEEVLRYWESRRMISMSMLNHTQTKNIDDRLVMALAYCKVNANNDAAVTVQSAIRQFEDFKADAYPNYTNMF